MNKHTVVTSCDWEIHFIQVDKFGYPDFVNTRVISLVLEKEYIE